MGFSLRERLRFTERNIVDLSKNGEELVLACKSLKHAESSRDAEEQLELILGIMGNLTSSIGMARSLSVVLKLFKEIKSTTKKYNLDNESEVKKLSHELLTLLGEVTPGSR